MNYKLKAALTLLAAIFVFILLCPTLASAEEGTPCPADPVNMFISYGADIVCAIDLPGVTDLFRFNGTAGERIEIETLGTGYPCIELIGVASACAFRSNQNWIDTVLPSTQEYTIRISDQVNGTGTYTLFLERTVPNSPNARQTTYGQYVTDSFPIAGDLDEFFFTASATDVLDLTTLGGSTTYPCFTIYAPDGTTTWNACAFRSHSNELRTPPLPLSGNYTILVYDQINTVGGYTVIPQCIAGVCNVTQIPDLSGYLTLRGAPLANQLVGIVSPSPGGDQITTTDMNGYYQFLQVPPGTFTVYAPISGAKNAASANSVHSDKERQ